MEYNIDYKKLYWSVINKNKINKIDTLDLHNNFFTKQSNTNEIPNLKKDKKKKKTKTKEKKTLKIYNLENIKEEYLINKEIENKLIEDEIELFKKENKYKEDLEEIENKKKELEELNIKLNTKFKFIEDKKEKIEENLIIDNKNLKIYLLNKLVKGDLEEGNREEILNIILELENKKEEPKKINTKNNNRKDKTYPKCPNGCGFKRNTPKGFKSHLGFIEGGADNCPKKNKVIKKEEDLNAFIKEVFNI